MLPLTERSVSSTWQVLNVRCSPLAFRFSRLFALTSRRFLFFPPRTGVSKSGVSNDRLKEAQAINLSLSALGDVISALSRGESFVPYRNHKLTLLMSDSLGGNAKTLMIACVSPAASNVEESLSSLSFATRAKLITNNPVKTVCERKEKDTKHVIYVILG
jgi:hypothetical protein